MTNYNDGEWHVWNGGECPVHPKSIVEAVWHDPLRTTAGVTYHRPAGEPCPNTGRKLAWSHIVKFRVVKEHKEPREFWVAVNYSGNVIDIVDGKPNDTYGYIKVREVCEDV